MTDLRNKTALVTKWPYALFPVSLLCLPAWIGSKSGP